MRSVLYAIKIALQAHSALSSTYSYHFAEGLRYDVT